VVTRHTPYDDLPEWLSIDEVQAYLDIKRTCAYEAARSGQLGRVQKAGRQVRVHKSVFASDSASTPIMLPERRRA
jgi:excisionase family DNA binding protein